MDPSRPGGVGAYTTYLDEEIEQLSRRSPTGLAEGVIRLLQSPSSARGIQELMRDLCGDEALLAECARRSTAHPLGFDKVILLDRRDYQLQMHVWWPTRDSRPHEDIHDHRFDFASTVLLGRLLAETFDVGGDGASMARYTQRSSTSHGDYQFRHEDYVPTRLVHAGVLPAGSAYFLDSHMLHRVVVDEKDLVVTLFLRLWSERDTATVLISPGLPAKPANLEKAQMGQEELRTKIRVLRAALET